MIDETDDVDEMEIDDVDEMEVENWLNSNLYLSEKYWKDFTQIKPKPDNEEDTEVMIAESDPIKRAEALLNKAFHTVTFASPNTNPVYFEADGETEKTQEFWNKISDGAMCVLLFPAYNWDGCINVGDYYPHDYKNEGVPDNLLGGICKLTWIGAIAIH